MHTLCRLSCKDDNNDNLVGKMSAGADLFVYICLHTNRYIVYGRRWMDRSVNCMSIFNLQYTCTVYSVHTSTFTYKHLLISLYSFQDIYILGPGPKPPKKKQVVLKTFMFMPSNRH